MSHNYLGITNNPIGRQRVIDPWCFWVNAFSNEELEKIKELMSRTQVESAKISGLDNNKSPIENGVVDSSIRSSRVAFHNPNNENRWIFDRFNRVIESLNSQYFNFDINGYSAFQYSEYHAEEQGKYDWHMDIYLGDVPTHEYETRKLSLTMLLNEPGVDFEGGDFELIQSSLDKHQTIQLEKGKIVVFPSFIFHRVKPVTRGVRKSLVIWVVGPKFR